MPQVYYSIVVNDGARLITNAPLLGNKVNITQIAVGDGNGAYYRPVPDMKNLKHETWRGTVTKYTQESDNIIVVHGVVPANIGGFVIREMSVISDDGTTIAIGNTPDLPKVMVEDGFMSDMELRMRIIVTNTEVIECRIDPHVVIATMYEVNKRPIAQAIASRPRDSSKPIYGADNENLLLRTAPYTGKSEIALQLEDQPYDVPNMSALPGLAPGGTVIIRRLED